MRNPFAAVTPQIVNYLVKIFVPLFVLFIATGLFSRRLRHRKILHESALSLPVSSPPSLFVEPYKPNRPLFEGEANAKSIYRYTIYVERNHSKWPNYHSLLKDYIARREERFRQFGVPEAQRKIDALIWEVWSISPSDKFVAQTQVIKRDPFFLDINFENLESASLSTDFFNVSSFGKSARDKASVLVDNLQEMITKKSALFRGNFCSSLGPNTISATLKNLTHLQRKVNSRLFDACIEHLHIGNQPLSQRVTASKVYSLLTAFSRLLIISMMGSLVYLIYQNENFDFPKLVALNAFESWNMGRQLFTVPTYRPVANEHSFSVMQYNILNERSAQKIANFNFPNDAPQRARFNWRSRFDLTLKELNFFKPDIFIIHHIDKKVFDEIISHFTLPGDAESDSLDPKQLYKGEFSSKIGIFYKGASFESDTAIQVADFRDVLANSPTITKSEFVKKNMHDVSKSLITLPLKHTASQKIILVAATHFVRKRSLEYIKRFEAFLLMNLLNLIMQAPREGAAQPSLEYLVLGCTLNAIPGKFVYNYVMNTPNSGDMDSYPAHQLSNLQDVQALMYPTLNQYQQECYSISDCRRFRGTVDYLFVKNMTVKNILEPIPKTFYYEYEKYQGKRLWFPLPKVPNSHIPLLAHLVFSPEEVQIAEPDNNT